jgi:hypothetical protein
MDKASPWLAMRTVAAWALPIAKADTTAKAVKVRLKECMRMKKLLKERGESG